MDYTGSERLELQDYVVKKYCSEDMAVLMVSLCFAILNF